MTPPASTKHCLTIGVRTVRRETERINLYELMDEDDWELPPFTPGAHIDVHIPGGYVRQYSLCSDPADRQKYCIAVQREPAGRGGSINFHERVSQGSTLPISLPRNRFPLIAAARRRIYVAGGIGITPFMSVIPVLQREGRPFFLHVCTRRREETPFLPLLEQLVKQGAAQLHHDAGHPSRGLNVGQLLAQPQDGDLVYCCGPAGLMDAVRRATNAWAPGTVRFESFSTPPLEQSTRGASSAYVVELARSGRTITVSPGETMLSALQRNGVPVISGCEIGTCSTCRVRYLAGDPEHRDFVLSSEERRQFLTSCVSGSRSGEPIVLDL